MNTNNSLNLNLSYNSHNFSNINNNNANSTNYNPTIRFIHHHHNHNNSNNITPSTHPVLSKPVHPADQLINYPNNSNHFGNNLNNLNNLNNHNNYNYIPFQVDDTLSQLGANDQHESQIRNQQQLDFLFQHGLLPTTQSSLQAPMTSSSTPVSLSPSPPFPTSSTTTTTPTTNHNILTVQNDFNNTSPTVAVKALTPFTQNNIGASFLQNEENTQWYSTNHGNLRSMIEQCRVVEQNRLNRHHNDDDNLSFERDAELKNLLSQKYIYQTSNVPLMFSVIRFRQQLLDGLQTHAQEFVEASFKFYSISRKLCSLESDQKFWSLFWSDGEERLESLHFKFGQIRELYSTLETEFFSTLSVIVSQLLKVGLCAADSHFLIAILQIFSAHFAGCHISNPLPFPFIPSRHYLTQVYELSLLLGQEDNSKKSKNDGNTLLPIDIESNYAAQLLYFTQQHQQQQEQQQQDPLTDSQQIWLDPNILKLFDDFTITSSYQKRLTHNTIRKFFTVTSKDFTQIKSLSLPKNLRKFKSLANDLVKFITVSFRLVRMQFGKCSPEVSLEINTNLGLQPDNKNTTNNIITT
jgi:hypothetical protein